MSDLLIRGFRLPKYDSVTITIYPNGVAKRFNEKTSHPPKIFRATQLPPHGRLIDADGEIGVNVTMMPGGKCKVDLIAPTVIPVDKEEG